MGRPGGTTFEINIMQQSISLQYLIRVMFLLSFVLIIFQHPLMPPYGTPVPYPAIYPHGGVYAHPNMATVILVCVCVCVFCIFF